MDMDRYSCDEKES